MRAVLAPAVVAALLLASVEALAWGKGGHMMSAHIAYGRLGAHARGEVDRLLALDVPLSEGADFVRASYWADEVRARLKDQYGWSDVYHYVDYPFSPDGTALPAGLPKARNVVRALSRYVAVLRSPAAGDAKKAEALRFVIHFVADVHQPLHGASRVTRELPGGDGGGNAFPLQDPAGEDPKYNLHKYWDAGMERFPRMGPDFAPPPMSEIPPAAARAVARNPESADAWRSGGATAYTLWARESAGLARKRVYEGVVAGERPDAAYERRSLRTAERRIAWSGYRLARLLNAIWP